MVCLIEEGSNLLLMMVEDVKYAVRKSVPSTFGVAGLKIMTHAP